MTLLDKLKELIPDEIIDGSNVDETAEIVDLDIAYKLLVVKDCVRQSDEQLWYDIPPVERDVIKRPDGKYEIRWQGNNGPDFEVVPAEQMKVMRARYLLLRGFYHEHFRHLTLPKQNEAACKYEITWIPPQEQ